MRGGHGGGSLVLTQKLQRLSCRSLIVPRDELDGIPSFHYLLKRKQWDQIFELLQLQTIKQLQKWLKPYSNTIVHDVLHCRPTYEVLDLMLDKLYELDRSNFPETAVNEHGQTPLHSAVSLQVSPNIIQRLLQHTSVGAVVTDHCGRLPLHYACCNPNKKPLPRWWKSTHTSRRLWTVQILLDVYPQAVLFRDNHGQTAYALAVQHHLDVGIANYLSNVQLMILQCQFRRTSDDSSSSDPLCDLSLAPSDDDDDVSSLGSEAPYQRVAL